MSKWFFFFFGMFLWKNKMCTLKCQGMCKPICKVTWVSFCPQIQSSIPLCLGEELDPSVFSSRRKTNGAVFQQLKTILRYTDQFRLKLKLKQQQYQQHHHSLQALWLVLIWPIMAKSHLSLLKLHDDKTRVWKISLLDLFGKLSNISFRRFARQTA